MGTNRNEEEMTYSTSCDCLNRMILKTAHAVGEKSYQSEISICRDCGRFHIAGWANNEYFSEEFKLTTGEQLTIAGTFLRYMSSERIISELGGSEEAVSDG
jgi:hypothetical protein